MNSKDVFYTVKPFFRQNEIVLLGSCGVVIQQKRSYCWWTLERLWSVTSQRFQSNTCVTVLLQHQRKHCTHRDVGHRCCTFLMGFYVIAVLVLLNTFVTKRRISCHEPPNWIKWVDPLLSLILIQGAQTLVWLVWNDFHICWMTNSALDQRMYSMQMQSLV